MRQGTPATQAIRSSCGTLGATALGQGMKVQESMQCSIHSLFQMRKLKAREKGSCLCTLGSQQQSCCPADSSANYMLPGRTLDKSTSCHPFGSPTLLPSFFLGWPFSLCLRGCSQERLGEQLCAPHIKSCVFGQYKNTGLRTRRLGCTAALPLPCQHVPWHMALLFLLSVSLSVKWGGK